MAHPERNVQPSALLRAQGPVVQRKAMKRSLRTSSVAKSRPPTDQTSAPPAVEQHREHVVPSVPVEHDLLGMSQLDQKMAEMARERDRPASEARTASLQEPIELSRRQLRLLSRSCSLARSDASVGSPAAAANVRILDVDEVWKCVRAPMACHPVTEDMPPPVREVMRRLNDYRTTQRNCAEELVLVVKFYECPLQRDGHGLNRDEVELLFTGVEQIAMAEFMNTQQMRLDDTKLHLVVSGSENLTAGYVAFLCRAQRRTQLLSRIESAKEPRLKRARLFLSEARARHGKWCRYALRNLLEAVHARAFNRLMTLQDLVERCGDCAELKEYKNSLERQYVFYEHLMRRANKEAAQRHLEDQTRAIELCLANTLARTKHAPRAEEQRHVIEQLQQHKPVKILTSKDADVGLVLYERMLLVTTNFEAVVSAWDTGNSFEDKEVRLLRWYDLAAPNVVVQLSKDDINTLFIKDEVNLPIKVAGLDSFLVLSTWKKAQAAAAEAPAREQ